MQRSLTRLSFITSTYPKFRIFANLLSSLENYERTVLFSFSEESQHSFQSYFQWKQVFTQTDDNWRCSSLVFSQLPCDITVILRTLMGYLFCFEQVQVGSKTEIMKPPKRCDTPEQQLKKSNSSSASSMCARGVSSSQQLLRQSNGCVIVVHVRRIVAGCVIAMVESSQSTSEGLLRLSPVEGPWAERQNRERGQSCSW